MPIDDDASVELCGTQNAFEAEMIAESLRARGIQAHAITMGAAGVQWEGGINNYPRVFVRAGDQESAARALVQIRREASQISWVELAAAAQEAGPEGEFEPAEPVSPSRGRGYKWLLYIGLALVLLGFFARGFGGR